VTPYISDQELNVGYNYWEGAVRAEGTLAGQKFSGSGYVELTGYAGSMSGQF
jgi:predicted secreted hydrolase